MSRTIILHYHLFKNAGTSFDKVLQRNFPGQWVTREFHGENNTEEVIQWIEAEPEAIAFSSHTMMGPLPIIKGIEIISVVFLRDPIDRIQSAYNFEKKQTVDTLGAQLAKEHDLQGYVRARLALKKDRQCRNFQVYRLASLLPGPADELDRAIQATTEITHVGRVEEFSLSINDLGEKLKSKFPNFLPISEFANKSKEAKLDLPQDLLRLLTEENQKDLQLIDRIFNS